MGRLRGRRLSLDLVIDLVVWTLIAAGVVAAVIAYAAAARAAPPAEGSMDWQLLHPHKAWIENLKDNEGRGCCSMSDCRPVDARLWNGAWQIRFRREQFGGAFPGAPADWKNVPAEALLIQPNPTGVPIACIAGGRILCFVPPGAV